MKTSSILVITPYRAFTSWIPGHRKFLRDISFEIDLTSINSNKEGTVFCTTGSTPSAPIIMSSDRDGVFRIRGNEITIETEDFRLDCNLSHLPLEEKADAILTALPSKKRKKVLVVHVLQ